ncbi:MAG TPA: antibiotic biosynthesis monooxygenase [Nitrososphaeraceae archaeon]|nr:antibiotic biosynthesis monooxygenase [Nitrososphaeraceae archaeon]
MSSTTNDSVTVVVTRRVKSGYESQYENWLKRLLEEAKFMKGYIGATVQKPAPGTMEYTSVFRFDNVENLRKFEESEIRIRYLREVVDYVEADAVWKKFSGLEFWFSPPKGSIVPQPSRFRMALVMIVVVYGLVILIGQLVATLVGDIISYFVRLFITISIEIFLMTFVLMPHLTRLLARWIYPKSKPNKQQ